MGNIADKLNYLDVTKKRLFKAMTDLGYEIDRTTTFREAVDMLLEESIRHQADDFDVSDLPEYWHESMRDALVYTLMLGDEYVHHLVTTDNHYEVNQKKSVTIQRLLFGTGLFSKVLNLGDITDGKTEGQAAHAIEDYHDNFGDNFLFAIGNHDDFNLDNSLLLPLVEDNASLHGDVQHFNYYLDDDENKIRYVVVNTPKSDGGAATAVERVRTAPFGYHVMLLTHYPFYSYYNDFWGEDDIREPWNVVGDNGLLQTVLLNNIPFIGILCGHEHTDGYVDYLDFGLVSQTALSNDSYGQKDAAPWPKTVGTNTEQAVTIVSVNTKTNDVRFYRIGMPCRFGRRWSYRYNAAQNAQFVKSVLLSGGQSITKGTESQFTYNASLPIRDGQGNQIPYFVINKSAADLYWMYEYQFEDGVYKARPSYKVNDEHEYSKVKRAAVTHGQNFQESNDRFLLGLEIQDGTADAEDFELVSSLADYDLGWDFSNVPWVSDCWWSTSTSNPGIIKTTESGYAGSKFIRVLPNTTYKFSVDDQSFSFVYGKVLGFDENGVFQGDLIKVSRRTATDMTFTTGESTKYVLITAENLSGLTAKAKLEEVTT